MADKQPMLPPPSEPFPGSRTPGWNDPPTLQYNPLSSSAATTGRSRLNLNKRVAFPLQGTTGASGVVAAGSATSKPTAIVPPNQASIGSGLPLPISLPSAVGTASSGATQPIAVVHPMPNMNAPPPVSRIAGTATTSDATGRTTSVIELPADALECTLRGLRAQLPCVQESPNVRREEIERRLGIIEQLWESGNLTRPVQEKLYQIGKAITEKNYSAAMDVCTALVTNHSNECSTWSVVLRHIVLTLQPVASEPISVESGIVVSSESSSSNIAIVPAMFVPAMPRHTAETDVINSSTANSRVQHI